jgi:hypothetical protein
MKKRKHVLEHFDMKVEKKCIVICNDNKTDLT